MPTPAFVRVLSTSLVALALLAGGCDKAGKSGPADGKAAEPSAKAPAGDSGAPIAGKPVEGEGKTAVAAGGGAEAKEYELKIEPATAKAGEESKVSIKVVPQGPWHMNLEYPTKLEITAPDGTTVAKPALAKADAVKLDEQGCEFSVAFTPDAAGAKQFTGEFKFAICQDEACVPKTETLAFEVTVE